MNVFRRRLLRGLIGLAVFVSLGWTHGQFINGVTVLTGFGSGAYPFLNFIQNLGSTQASSGFAFPGVLNSNGFPQTASLSQKIFGSFSIPASYAGNWRLTWAGTQGISGTPGIQIAAPTTVSIGGSFVSGATTFNLSTFGTNGSITFTFNTPPSTVTVNFLSGAAYSGLTALALCQVDNGGCAALDAGSVLNPDFLSSVRGINPKIVRFLDWSGGFGNTTTVTRPTTYVTWLDAYWDSALWAGAATGTNTYAATLAGATLTDGQTVQTQFTNANTGASTFNLNGLGAVAIEDLSAAALISGEISANSLWTLIYDATLGVWMGVNAGIQDLVPISTIVATCNAFNSDCWINIPPHAPDAAIATMVNYVKANLNLNLTAHYEYGNEIWNFSSPETHWAQSRGNALGFPNANNEQVYGWYALRVRQIMANITTIYGAQKNYKRILAFQAFGTPSQTNTYRIQGHDLCGTSCSNATYQSLVGVDYNTAPNRPVDFTDEFSYATYYQGAIINDGNSYSGTYAVGDLADCSVAGTNSGGLLCAVNNFKLSTTASIAAAFAWVDNDIRAGTKNGTLGSETLLALNNNIYPGWNTIAASYGLPIVAYEGGYQGLAPTTAQCTAISYPGNAADCGASGNIATMLAAYKNNALFHTLVQNQFTQFLAASPAGSRVAWFAFGTGDGPQWSLFPGDLYSTPFQSYGANAARNHGLSN